MTMPPRCRASSAEWVALDEGGFRRRSASMSARSYGRFEGVLAFRRSEQPWRLNVR